MRVEVKMIVSFIFLYTNKMQDYSHNGKITDTQWQDYSHDGRITHNAHNAMAGLLTQLHR